MDAHTLVQVLAHHGITDATDSNDTATDNAREAGIIYACLGCGTVGGINPDDLKGYATVEDARVATRDNYVFDCCPDSTTVLF